MSAENKSAERHSLLNAPVTTPEPSPNSSFSQNPAVSQYQFQSASIQYGSTAIGSTNGQNGQYGFDTPSDWAIYQDYRYASYYHHVPTGRNTWAHPVTGDLHPEAASGSDSYDLPDGDVVELQRSHHFWYTTSPQSSPYFPYYPNPTQPPGIMPSSKVHPRYWDQRIKRVEELLDQNDRIQLIISDIKSPQYSTHHVVQPQKYDVRLSWYQLLCGTIHRNGLISLFSFFLWSLFIALLVGWALYFRTQHWKPDGGVGDLVYNSVQIAMELVGWNGGDGHSFSSPPSSSPSSSSSSQPSTLAFVTTLFSNTTATTTTTTATQSLTKKDSPMLSFGLCLISAVLVYSIYILSWVWVPMFGWLCCGSPKSGVFGTHDKMVESLKQSNPTATSSSSSSQQQQHHQQGSQPSQYYTPLDELKERVVSMENAAPKLWLQVECSHHYLPYSTSRFRRTCCDNITTLFGFWQGHYVHKTTFVAYEEVPIVFWRDVSPSSHSILSTIKRARRNAISSSSCIPFNFSLDIHTLFQLHPSQKKYLEMMRMRLYHAHSFRDAVTKVYVKYQIDPNHHNSIEDSIDITKYFQQHEILKMKAQAEATEQQQQQQQPQNSEQPPPPPFHLSPLTLTLPFEPTEDDPQVPSLRKLPIPQQRFRVALDEKRQCVKRNNNCGSNGQHQQHLPSHIPPQSGLETLAHLDYSTKSSGDVEIDGGVGGGYQSDNYDDDDDDQQYKVGCCFGFSRWLLFSPMTFIWLHLGLYLPLLMLFRAGNREMPYVNVKYLVLGTSQDKRKMKTEQHSTTTTTPSPPISNSSTSKSTTILSPESNPIVNSTGSYDANALLRRGFVDKVLHHRPRIKYQWTWADELILPHESFIGDAI